MRHKLGVFLGVTIVMFLFTTAGVWGDTIYVPGDYATIQEAVNNATTGDTIMISGGPYPEQITINTSGITLQGDGSYPKINPLLDNGIKYDTIIKVKADNTTIKGLEIYNAGGALTGSNEHHAIWDESWTVGPSGMTVDDCVIHDIQHGVRSYGDDLTVTNCEMYNLRRSGVHASGPSGSDPLSFLIKNNWFHDWVEYFKEGAAIFIKYDRRVGEASFNYISGMRMGIAYYYGGPAYGGQVVFKNNTIDLDYDPGSGPVTTTMGISFWGTGANADSIFVKDNIFANALWYAIYQEGATISGSITVHNNLFYNNYFHYWPDYQYPYQWFGDDTRAQAGWNNGPADGFTFTDNITIQDPLFALTGVGPDEQWALLPGSPCLGTASDGSNIGANQSSPPAHVWVDDDYTSGIAGWLQDRFDNIADGIDAVDTTGTVTIYPGIYRENLAIDKGITLEGSGLPFLEGEPTSTGLTISVPDVTISGLAIHHYNIGIDATTSGSAEISSCFIFENTSFGVRNQSDTRTVIATNNWWGDNSGPAALGNPVSGDVIYDPWIGKTGDPKGAKDYNPGATGIAGTGTGKSEVEIYSNGSIYVALLLLAELEGTLPQGYVGFAGGNAIDRRVSVVPYYLENGQFMATVKLYYTQQDIIDAGITEPSWLSVYSWDQPSSRWVLAVTKNMSPSTENAHQGDKAPDTVLGHFGTYVSQGYCWANVDHFSEFAAGQDPTVPVELSVFSLE